MRELRILPIRTSKKVSSGQSRDIIFSCSGLGREFFLMASSVTLFSLEIVLASVSPFRIMSYSRSFISLSNNKKDPTSLLPVSRLMPGLSAEACVR